MKYIRTKDGKIIETPFMTDLDKPYKFADTIEELCDEFVFFDKDNKPHYKSQEGNIWYLGAALYIETLRYGIFTDKGLIYVAKMNDEGKLVLL